MEGTILINSNSKKLVSVTIVLVSRVHTSCEEWQITVGGRWSLVVWNERSKDGFYTGTCTVLYSSTVDGRR
jgi:hypothetical protein